MSSQFRYFTYQLALLVLLLVAMPVGAQTANPLQADLTRALAALQTQAESPQRAAQEKDLLAAQQLLSETTAAQNQAQVYRTAASTENETIATLNETLSRLKSAPARIVPTNADDQSTASSEAEGLLGAKRSTLDELTSRKTSLSGRSSAISKDIATLQTALEELQSQPVNDDPNYTLIANITIADYRQRISTLQTELATLPARQRILDARIALASQEYESLLDYVTRLKNTVSENRVTASQAYLETANDHLSRVKTSALKLVPIAEETKRLAEKLLSVTQETGKLDDLASEIDGVFQRVTTSASTVDRVLAARELTDETAGLLRRVQTSLPDLAGLKVSLAESEKTQTDLQLRTILWEDRLQTLGRFQTTEIEFLKAQLADQNGVDELAASNPELIQAMQTLRRDLLGKLIDAASIDSERRTNTDIATRKTITLTEGIKTRLERRLLWLKTNASSPTQAMKNMPAGLKYLFSPAHWRGAFAAFKARLSASPIWLLWLLGVPGLLWGLRPFMKKRLAALAARVGKPMTSAHSDRFWVTPAALVLSILIAAPLGFMLASAGAILSTPGVQPDFTKALSVALTITACVFFVLFTFKTMCRDNGLLDKHLGWSQVARHTLSRHLTWFTPIVSLADFVFIMAVYENIPELRYGLALLAFVSLSISLAYMIFVFFRPKGGVAASIVMETPASPFLKFIFPLLVLIPLGLGIAPLFGYFDTAVELQSRIFRTGVLALIIAIFYGLLIRTFNIAHDRYQIKLRWERDAQAVIDNQSKLEADQSGEARPTTPKPLAEEHLSTQIRKSLLTISVLVFLYGLWQIWGQLLPALRIADDITLWTQMSLVNGEEVLHPVTVSSLFVAGLILFGSLIAARNVKAILELLAFNRLNLDSGTKYAAVTILGYVLVGSGVVFSLALLGLDWSKLQWVVAALGVGIGFGLQEIIANFISGIIILFERPVRVGDIVTINNLSGTVNNIKIRATTITDFDNREVLLPNKSIITGEVTNWTLNNSVTRLIINIGVAYGSDVTQVRKLLTDILNAHPDVLKDPAPTVFFTAHGDSSLDFEIRLFVAAPFQRLPTTHDINAAINLALAANNIEIPFPQRDVNMRQIT